MESAVAELSKDLEYHYLMSALNASVSKHLLDDHFTLVAANHRYYELFGYEKEEYEALFHNRPDLFYQKDPDDWQALNDIVVKTLTEGKKRYECICRMRHKNGTRLWIKLVGIFIDEYVNGYQISYSAMMDITDVMMTKIEKDVTQNNFPGLISKYRVTENGFEFIDGNEAFHRYFRNKISFRLDEMDEYNGLNRIKEMYTTLRKGEAVSFMISPLDEEGNQRFLHINAQCIDWIDKDPIYLLIYTNVTELTRQKQQLEEYNKSLHRLAFTDDATGGFNRRKFDFMAGEAVRSSKPDEYDMIWFNLQKFKLINELGGVEAGDRVLKYIHEKILKHLHEKEFVARLFSDNFVLLMKHESKQHTEERLDKIIEDINGYNEEASFKYYLTFTAGIYNIHDINEPITYMEDRAHAAKKMGNVQSTDMCIYSYYSEQIRQQMLGEKNIENKMREALINEEFEVYLQPKYDVQSSKIAGAEALIRWNDPQRGLISPSEFIPVFEANGFIIKIDLFVFEKVCQLLRRWIDQGRATILISVNMSRVHFQENCFLDEYIRILKDYQIPAELIEIELTETLVFENPEAFTNIIKEIHKAGFRCSMDDFGSGYSTLNTLKDLEVDAIKLDRAFFSSENMENEKENIIIKSVLDMAKALHMTTIAEGVETLGQTRFLQNTTCDLIQGFFFSKPVPIKEFEELMNKE